MGCYRLWCWTLILINDIILVSLCRECFLLLRGEAYVCAYLIRFHNLRLPQWSRQNMWGAIFDAFDKEEKWPKSTLKGFSGRVAFNVGSCFWIRLVKLGFDRVRHWSWIRRWIWIRHWILGPSTHFDEPLVISPKWDAGWWAGVTIMKGSTPTLRYVSQYLQEMKRQTGCVKPGDGRSTSYPS